MNIRILLPGCALVVALLLPLSATAQRTSRITFVMPQSVDPVRLTVTQDGFEYTNSDGSVPGDNAGPQIRGLTFLPPENDGAGGLEVHGAIPGPIESFVPIQEVVLRTNYLGAVIEIESIVAPEFTQFDPWLAIDASVPNERIFRFIKQPGSATLNINQYFGLFRAVSDDPDFAAAPFTVTGYTSIQGVPEPGSVALLLALTAGSAVPLLRRRRKNRSRKPPSASPSDDERPTKEDRVFA